MIILNSERLKVYDGLQKLCQYAGKTTAYGDALWSDMLDDDVLYSEFVYYLENHTLQGNKKCCGYSLLDIYVWQIENYNLRQDVGRNPEVCNKEEMVLESFRMLKCMEKDPDVFIQKMQEGRHNDKE